VAVEPLSLKGFSRPIPAHDVLRWRDAPAAGII
jgi:hypothetical protein